MAHDAGNHETVAGEAAACLPFVLVACVCVLDDERADVETLDQRQARFQRDIGRAGRASYPSKGDGARSRGSPRSAR